MFNNIKGRKPWVIRLHVVEIEEDIHLIVGPFLSREIAEDAQKELCAINVRKDTHLTFLNKENIPQYVLGDMEIIWKVEELDNPEEIDIKVDQTDGVKLELALSMLAVNPWKYLEEKYGEDLKLKATVQ